MWGISAGVARRRRLVIYSLARVGGAMRQNLLLRDNLPGMGSRDNQPGGTTTLGAGSATLGGGVSTLRSNVGLRAAG